MKSAERREGSGCMDNECLIWLNEAKEVFSSLRGKQIVSNYKKMTRRKIRLCSCRDPQKTWFWPWSIAFRRRHKCQKETVKT